MPVLLPILALGTYVLALKARVLCWREAILGGAVLWGVVLVGITEALSSFRALTMSGFAAAWLLAFVAGAAVVARTRSWPRCAWPPGRINWLGLGLLGPLGVAIVVLGIVAVVCPPNTWDSMTYHMARLIHWQQNASLVPYPTHILRQLYLQPGAEYILLQLQVLSGGDRLAGLVQWACMISALIGVSLLARDVGASQPGALCATLFAASLPIGVLESTSTQNDYVVTFWLVCVVTFALRTMRPPTTFLIISALGASLGLALLTKATAYLVALPFLVWVAVCLVRRLGSRAIALLAVAGAIALVLNAGFYSRNVLEFGSPFGPPDEGTPTLRYTNAALTPALLASNIVRDLGLNLIATPVAAVNVRALNLVRAVHGWSGVDIADPRTTWGDEKFAEQPVGLAFDENRASNPVHLFLILLALAAMWPLRRRLPPFVMWYAVALSAGFLVFAAVLRWQPWHTRLELPFFVLGAPLVGIVAERIGSRLAIVLSALLLASMVPWVVYNQARPLVGTRSILAASRADQYFTNRPGVRSAYEGAAGFLLDQGCGHIGFVSEQDGWEYPLWALLRDPVDIEHVGVSNVSAAHPESFDPCAVFAFGAIADMGSIEVAGHPYEPRWTSGAGLDKVTVLTAAGR